MIVTCFLFTQQLVIQLKPSFWPQKCIVTALLTRYYSPRRGLRNRRLEVRIPSDVLAIKGYPLLTTPSIIANLKGRSNNCFWAENRRFLFPARKIDQLYLRIKRFLSDAVRKQNRFGFHQNELLEWPVTFRARPKHRPGWHLENLRS